MIDIQTEIAFFVLAVASVASAIGVITFKNAVHCALSLILTLLFLALFYLQLGAMFIAIVQILIYAGAIMVLFLFVVTMLASEADDTELEDRIPWQRWVAGVLGLTLIGALSYLLFTGTGVGAKASGGSLSHAVSTQGNVEAFGLALFHGFAFPFEVTSLIIVVAILGALVLGRSTPSHAYNAAGASPSGQAGRKESARIRPANDAGASSSAQAGRKEGA